MNIKMDFLLENSTKKFLSIKKGKVGFLTDINKVNKSSKFSSVIFFRSKYLIVI